MLVASGFELEEIRGTDDPILQKIEGAAIYDALQELSEPLRQTVVAVDIVDLSYREAARALGTREGTIMSRLHRGRGQVAAALRPTSGRPGLGSASPRPAQASLPRAA